MLGEFDTRCGARYARVCELVRVLSELQVPPVPATLEASQASRGNVHFVIKTLWSTPFFARHPHVMWIFRDLLNQTVEEALRGFVLMISSAGSTTSGLPHTMAPVPAEGSMLSSDLAYVIARLEDRVADSLNSLHDTLETVVETVAGFESTIDRRTSTGSRTLEKPDPVKVDGKLISYLERKGIPDFITHASTLFQACITVQQLEDHQFTRSELMAIGLPLGVCAHLLPRDGLLQSHESSPATDPS